MKKLIITTLVIIGLYIISNCVIILLAKSNDYNYNLIFREPIKANSEVYQYHDWVLFSSPWGEPHVIDSVDFQSIVFKFTDKSMIIFYKDNFAWEDFIPQGFNLCETYYLRRESIKLKSTNFSLFSSPYNNFKMLLMMYMNYGNYYDAISIIFYEQEELNLIQFNRKNSIIVEMYTGHGKKYLLWISGPNLAQDDIDLILGSIEFTD